MHHWIVIFIIPIWLWKNPPRLTYFISIMCVCVWKRHERWIIRCSSSLVCYRIFSHLDALIMYKYLCTNVNLCINQAINIYLSTYISINLPIYISLISGIYLSIYYIYLYIISIYLSIYYIYLSICIWL